MFHRYQELTDIDNQLGYYMSQQWQQLVIMVCVLVMMGKYLFITNNLPMVAAYMMMYPLSVWSFKIYQKKFDILMVTFRQKIEELEDSQ